MKSMIAPKACGCQLPLLNVGLKAKGSVGGKGREGKEGGR